MRTPIQIWLQALVAVVIVAALVASRSHAAPAGSPVLIATADTEGHVEPCTSCPGSAGLGGLARRATLLATERANSPDVLLVDAGNAFFGGQSGVSQGKVVAAAYQRIRYDAVNVSYRDFRLGKAHTLELLKSANLPAISANVLDSGTGQPLFAPFIMKRIGTSRVAIIGVTESPAALDALPELREQLEGIRIAPPVDALAQWLPKLHAQADSIVLLYYGSALGLAPIRERFAGDFSAIVLGGSRADQVPASASPVMLIPAMHGRELSRWDIGSAQAPRQMPVSATTPQDAGMKQLLADYLLAAVEGPAAAAPASPVPASGKEDAHVEAAHVGDPHLALNRYLQFAQAARQQVLRSDKCPFDPAALVVRVGTDPAALAAYVREHVAYEPYVGSLRGPSGTLAAHSGGDWDRAALLQAALSHAGYSARLVEIDRSDAEAREVVDAFLKGTGRIASPASTGNAANAEQHAGGKDAEPDEKTTALLRRFGLPPENYQIHAGAGAAQWNGWLDEAFDAAAGQAPVVRQVLGASVAPPSFDKLTAPLIAGARQRVLIEMDGPRGKVLLSPGPEAAVPGAAELASARRFDRVPPEQIGMFSVQLRMNVSGQAQPVVLLQQSAPLSDLTLVPIRLEIFPSGEMNAGSPADWTVAQWYEHVTNFKQFQAILHVGSAWHSSKVFDLDGQLHDVTPDGQIKSVQDLGGGAQRGFGGFGGALGGGGGGAPAKPATHLQSLVLSFQFDLPGQAPIRQQRLLYDPQLRPGLTPAYSGDLLVSGAPLSPRTVGWMELDAATRNAAIIGPALTSGHAMHMNVADKIVRWPSVLYQWQLARLALEGRYLAANPALTGIGGPLAVLRVTQLRSDAANKSVVTRQGMDVLLDGQRILPRKAAASQAAFDANLASGIGETDLESVLLNGAGPAGASNVRGAWAAFDDAQAAGATPVLRLPGRPAPAAHVAPLAQWALANNPDSGAASLFGRAGASEWWQIELSSGRALGRGDDGAGQSTIEYYSCVKAAMYNLECMVGAVKGALHGDSANSTAGSWLGCITSTSNPGTYVSGAGGIQGVLYDGGSELSNIGDCMYGLYDLAGSLSGG